MKVKLGEYIKQSDLRNADKKIGVDFVVGLSTQKQIIKTVADMDSVPLRSYKLFPPKYFGYVPDTSRRGDKMSLGYNTMDKTFLVSSISIVFYISKSDELDSEYLFMYFNRPEFDRYARFNSWGSARETFSWEYMCDIELELPDIDTQRKFVAVYKAMVENQKCYENGLDDLKLTCDAYIENLRREMKVESIGKYIEQRIEKNVGNKIKLAQGVNVDMQFIPAKRIAEDKESAKIVRTGQFAFNKVMKANGTKLPIALRTGADCFVSGSYQVFEVINQKKLLPEYLMLWLARTEIQRYAGFISWGSTRDVLDFETLGEIEIPIPEIEVQEAIVNIYKAYIMRREINERLKAQIKDICRVLIKGATSGF